MKSKNNFDPPVEIPVDAISTEALRGVIVNFIEREGTDYGVFEVSFEKKIEQVQKQILKGDVKIAFDPSSETVTLLTKRDWQKLSI